MTTDREPDRDRDRDSDRDQSQESERNRFRLGTDRPTAALETLSERSAATAPGTQAHRDAAVAVAERAGERPAAVVAKAQTLVAATERAMDAESTWTTAERTDEGRSATLEESREALVETLRAVANRRPAHSDLVPAVEEWLTDGGQRRFTVGLRVAEALSDTDADLRPGDVRTLARAFKPASDGDHPGLGEALEKLVAARRVAGDDGELTDTKLLSRLWRTRRRLSGTATDAIADAPESEVEDWLLAEYLLSSGDISAILPDCGRFLATVAERDLTPHAPGPAAGVASALLLAYDPEADSPEGYDDPDAVEQAVAVLAGAADRRPDLANTYERLGRAAQAHPSLFTDAIDALLSVVEATEASVSATTKNELLKGVAAVAGEAPGAVEPHVDRVATLLDSTAAPGNLATVTGTLGPVSMDYPVSVRPFVGDVLTLTPVDNEVFTKNALGLLVGVARAEPTPVLDARETVLELLARVDQDDLPSEWLDTLRELFGDAINDPGQGIQTLDRLVDELDSGTTLEDSVRERPVDACVAAVRAALDDPAESGGHGAERADEHTDRPRNETSDLHSGTALRSLSAVARERPRAVAPHVETLARAVETFEESGRVGSALLALARVANASPGVVVDHVEIAADRLGPDEDEFVYKNALWLLSTVAKEDPDAVTPHVDRIVACSGDNGEPVGTHVLVALMEVAKRRPPAVEDSLPLFVEGLRTDDSRRATASVALAAVARSTPEALVAHTDALVSTLDTADPDRFDGGVVEVLGVLTVERPTAVEPHVDDIITVLESTDDWLIAPHLVRILQNVSDENAEAVVPYVGQVADALLAYDPETCESTVWTDAETYDLFTSQALWTLCRATEVAPDLVRPHVEAVVHGFEIAESEGSARAAALTLVRVSEEFPEAVAPHLQRVAAAHGRFDRPVLASLVHDVEETVLDSDAEMTPQSTLGTFAYAVQSNLKTLLDRDDNKTFLWMCQAMLAIREDPAVGRDHVDEVAMVTAATENELVASAGVVGLHWVAKEYPEALTSHTDTVADIVDEALPNPNFAEDDNVLTHAMPLFAYVARFDPDAVAPHVDTIVAVLDPPAEAVADVVRGATIALAAVAEEHPDTVAPHVGVLAGGIAEIADAEGIHGEISKLMTAAGTDPERLQPHTECLAAPLCTQDGDARERVVDALLTEQWASAELKLVVVEILQEALEDDGMQSIEESEEPSAVSNASVDDELRRLVQEALQRLLSGSVPPEPTGAAADLLGRMGSTVPDAE